MGLFPSIWGQEGIGEPFTNENGYHSNDPKNKTFEENINEKVTKMITEYNNKDNKNNPDGEPEWKSKFKRKVVRNMETMLDLICSIKSRDHTRIMVQKRWNFNISEIVMIVQN